ncbi:MAG: DNA alkylation repair protein [Bacteroidaceae bacterium]|nr:DNA alkylation repair protein [Bacteroidaceae bacterium]
MEQDIHLQILEIKKCLRLSMNGVVSAHYRKQGVDYKINFGVEIPRLKSIAAQFSKDRELAKELWKENIRECKMLAIFLMPPNEFTVTDAEEWIASARFTEIADHIVMNLASKMPYKREKAYHWIESGEMLFPYCGFLIFARMFSANEPFTANEQRCYIAQALKWLTKNDSKVTANSAYTSLQRYIENDEKNNINMIREVAKEVETGSTSIIEQLLQQYE